jgi:hypothetical protein
MVRCQQLRLPGQSRFTKLIRNFFLLIYREMWVDTTTLSRGVFVTIRNFDMKFARFQKNVVESVLKYEREVRELFIWLFDLPS